MKDQGSEILENQVSARFTNFLGQDLTAHKFRADGIDVDKSATRAWVDEIRPEDRGGKKVSSVKVDGGWFPVARINGTIKRREDTEKNERRVK